jgi:hypothetical protein
VVLLAAYVAMDIARVVQFALEDAGVEFVIDALPSMAEPLAKLSQLLLDLR